MGGKLICATYFLRFSISVNRQASKFEVEELLTFESETIYGKWILWEMNFDKLKERQFMGNEFGKKKS